MATLACYAAALALTLALAAWLTPRRWWRRPNLQALSVTAAGTLAFGALFAAAAGSAAPPAPATAPVRLAATVPAPAGPGYVAADALNLRSAPGVRSPRVAVLPAGTAVAVTGIAGSQGSEGNGCGDWWRIRASVDGAPVEGWASSLWLRRVDERAGAARARRVR